MVLICNQPAAAEQVLDELRAKPSRASQQRLKRMLPRGKALTWDRLMRQPEYMRARELLRQTFA